jgi:hypothetical protein
MMPLVTTNSRFPFLADFSATDRALAEKAMQARGRQAQEAADAQAVKAAQARERAGRALRDSLGIAGIRTLREFMQQERLALIDSLQPPGGLGRDADALRRVRNRRAEAMLRRLGADKGTLKKIAAKYHETLAGLAPPQKASDGFHRRGNLNKWQALSPLHAGVLPDPGDADDPHRWFAFQPPFFGFNFAFSEASTEDFRVARLHHLDPQAGMVGHELTLDIDDAGDYEGAWGKADTQIAFGFVPPATGLLEVVIDAQSVDCRHELRTADEWGWSDSQTVQTNYLTLDVLHPNTPDTSLAALSDFHKDTGDSTNTQTQNLILGEHYFTVLRSNGALPAGKSVVLCVGTRSHDRCHSSDVAIHSRSLFRWFIRAVEVRVLP